MDDDLEPSTNEENILVRAFKAPFRFFGSIFDRFDLDYDLGFFSEDSTRNNIRKLIFWITGIIVFLILLRFTMDLFQITDNNFLFRLYGDFTDIFISSYEGIIQNTDPFFAVVNFDALIAAIVWLVTGILIAELVSSVMHDTFKEVVQSVEDVFFKILEFLIVTRVVFDILQVGGDSLFERFINFTTNWTTNVFDINILGDQINFSAMLVLGIIGVLDVSAERVIDWIFLQFEEKEE